MGRLYYTFNYPESASGGATFLTGIRGVEHHGNQCSDQVYISGVYRDPDNGSSGLVYKGLLNGQGKWHILNFPSSDGITVTGTSLYGPNNGPTNKTVQVVGNYNTQETGPIALGCLYEGHLDGSGKWTTLIPDLAQSVINTIAHSTMGGLIVGNYDVQLNLGRAFLYDIDAKKYYDITHKDAVSITAYGIWFDRNCSYTICGGYTPLNGFPGLTYGYIAHWDHKLKKLTNFDKYVYNNDLIGIVVTHFDGITSDGHCGYNLTGDWVGVKQGGPVSGAFFAHVPRLGGTAKWELIAYPNQPSTSGNSVYRSSVIGIYTTAENQINGYVAIKTPNKQ